MRVIRVALLLSLILVLSTPVTVRADDIIHTVQPGENLFRIGLKYGVPWQTIAAANGLTSTRIYVGQQLRIPVGGDTTTQTGTEAAPAPPTESAPSPAPAAPDTAVTPATYTVAPGETLGSIARRFGLTTGQLAAANNLANPDRIYYGQVLIVPGGAAASSGEGVPVSAPVSKRVVVDISEQHMVVYENGNVIWSWVTSTGERGRDTAPGNYSVLNKIPNAYASTWNLQMPYWLGIYWAGRLQNGIHALPILANGQKLWAGWLGTPVSYGCVILGDEEARTLYNWAEVGTPVSIQW